MKFITSTDNKIYKQTKKLLLKSERDKTGLFIAEGRRIAEEAVQCGVAEYIVVSESFGNFEADIPLYSVTDKMFSAVSETETTQGILAVCKYEKKRIGDIKGHTLIICDKVSDPGNLGTVIRTAEASGVSGILLLKGTVDPYSPKVVRSTMGSIFRMPLYFCEIKDLQNLSEYDIVATVLNAKESLYEAEFGKNNAIVIGNEAHGVSDEVIKMSKKLIKIPMEGKSESLNASVAGAVVMYEFLRRRGVK